MRTFVLILLVALLPLRLLAADGMAIRMAHVGAATASGQAAMPEDCPMMIAQGLAAAATSAAPDEAPAAAEHGSCLTCQLCAAFVAEAAAPLVRHALPGAAPDRASPRYASAVPLPEHKPPIA